jgi:hypothetical protein
MHFQKIGGFGGISPKNVTTQGEILLGVEHFSCSVRSCLEAGYRSPYVSRTELAGSSPPLNE